MTPRAYLIPVSVYDDTNTDRLTMHPRALVDGSVQVCVHALPCVAMHRWSLPSITACIHVGGAVHEIQHADCIDNTMKLILIPTTLVSVSLRRHAHSMPVPERPSVAC